MRDPFIPAPSEFDEFLADREALLLLDDCALDRRELETLLDRVPRCTVVLASKARSLWSRGTARGLADLDPAAAVGLLEREIGRSLGPDEREAAETVVARLGGNPQSLVETAALVEDGRSSLRQLADDPAALERRFDPSALTDSQKLILVVLSALDGAKRSCRGCALSRALLSRRILRLPSAPAPGEQRDRRHQQGEEDPADEQRLASAHRSPPSTRNRSGPQSRTRSAGTKWEHLAAEPSVFFSQPGA
jgi:hypothetical protein